MSVTSSAKKSNRLIQETSPYLLQHAYNPVDWYPWAGEALQKAKREDKVILISIGYSACHWCHVMERESFENEQVAEFMNEHFINIKIDREERPDLDHIYMDAVQAISGNGGWPLNVFLTPEKKPFYGGTYFPPAKAYNRSSWMEVLQAVNQAWKERKEEIKEQADGLVNHLSKSNSFGAANQQVHKDTGNPFSLNDLNSIFTNIMKTADTEWGGFGKAPKFPQTFIIQFLFQYHYYTKSKEALAQALLSLDKMLQGGIYDHIGGGLARYSTDNEWLAPHFEKMLYDNALLIKVLCDAFQITKKVEYEKAIRQTITFVVNELGNREGGFFSALDADSEGEEGKYYVWKKTAVEEVLGEDAELFCDFFNIIESGNWEGKNIPRILKTTAAYAAENGLEIAALEKKLDSSKTKLLQRRKLRTRPLLDDKVLLGWNALMITALTRAGATLADDTYVNQAIDCFEFLINNFKDEASGTKLHHTYKANKATYPAFLDDYASLIQAAIQLQEVTAETNYLNWAKKLTEHVIKYYSDPDSGYFFFTEEAQQDVILRKKEVYDGATPSGNSIMAENLLYLAVVFNKPEWEEMAVKILNGLHPAIVNYPASFANWAMLIMKRLFGINEIVITGKNYKEHLTRLLTYYLPDKIVQSGIKQDDSFLLLRGKNYGEKSTIYLCKNYQCQAPVFGAQELILQIAALNNNRSD